MGETLENFSRLTRPAAFFLVSSTAATRAGGEALRDDPNNGCGGDYAFSLLPFMILFHKVHTFCLSRFFPKCHVNKLLFQLPQNVTRIDKYDTLNWIGSFDSLKFGKKTSD